jgi:hypothetical protein
LKDNAWYPEKFIPKNQFTTMAMLEMLTGLKTEYAFKQWGGTEIKPSGKGNVSEYEQEWNPIGIDPENDDISKFQAWILGPEHTKPTPNWNPTIIQSLDKRLRAVKPAPNSPAGESFKYVYLLDSRSTAWPYYSAAGESSEMADYKKEYGDSGVGLGRLLWYGSHA